MHAFDVHYIEPASSNCGQAQACPCAHMRAMMTRAEDRAATVFEGIALSLAGRAPRPPNPTSGIRCVRYELFA